MPRHSTRETPFSLTYGPKVVIPTEVSLCSAQVSGFNPAQNDLMMVECLDLLEEYRETATKWLAKYQQGLARHYNRDVKTREFSAGDLVLRRAIENM